MKHIALILIVAAAFFAGCTEERKPYITSNQIMGDGFGNDGYTITIPEGYEIYTPERFPHKNQRYLANRLQNWADSHFRSGDNPYSVILTNGEVFMAFIPENEAIRRNYQRVSDAHYGVGRGNYSQLNTNDQLALLNDFMYGINTNRDTITDLQIESKLVNGVPIGIWSGFREILDNPYYTIFIASDWVICVTNTQS